MHLFSTPLKTENRKGFSELVFQANFVYREGDMPKNFASPNLQASKVVTYLDLQKLGLQNQFWSLGPGIFKFSGKVTSSSNHKR